MIVPSQDPACLDETRVEAWRRAIDAGERPAVVALAWHKLEAYVRAQVPARVIEKS